MKNNIFDTIECKLPIGASPSERDVEETINLYLSSLKNTVIYRVDNVIINPQRKICWIVLTHSIDGIDDDYSRLSAYIELKFNMEIKKQELRFHTEKV